MIELGVEMFELGFGVVDMVKISSVCVELIKVVVDIINGRFFGGEC